MFKKPFNKKVGETRECKGCGDTFFTDKPTWKCRNCVNAKQRIIEEKKRAKYPKKDKYPFDNRGTESSNRFCKIRTGLSNAWKEYNKTGDKTAINEHYNKQLQEIRDNGILQWIYDRRDKETIAAKAVKSKRQITQELPDTRGYHEE